MLDVIPWRPVQAIAGSWLQSLVCMIPTAGSWLSRAFLQRLTATPESGVPVFVMLPLDSAAREPRMDERKLFEAFDTLKGISVTGVMIDVWWGLCEQTPGLYDFEKYVHLFVACRERQLKVQATMSFHACGGNIGDSVNIPLPSWVVEAGDKYGFWFQDRGGRMNREYISFGADHEPLLDGARGEARKRTPLQAYGSFIRAFVERMREERLMGSTVTELQIGMGPCGELRYPSYPLSVWQFPGIGEFQCFDRFLLKDLKDTVREKGSENVKEAYPLSHSHFPSLAGTGSYNSKPWDTEFFTRGFRTEAGNFFLQWYSSRMLEHGEDVLKQARSVIPVDDDQVTLAVKVSGVHWWKFTSSRAAEATAGYVSGCGVMAYGDIAKLLNVNNSVLDFTCLEMRTIDQPFLTARCGPRQLVTEVFEIAKREGVAVAGENALERYDWGAYAQIASAFRICGARRYGFTLLRLGEGLMEEKNLRLLQRFVGVMNEIS
eukprot:GFKZ01008781.1.p1 GENE.GFKZ01008781.1~~GFKZ01008781.1.p1  ORF type:complete len:490 (-),score=46.92 GFKZ01008781.1:167-1636(-)